MNHVLIATGTRTQNGTRVYHEPSEDNPQLPKCSKKRAESTRWAQKDPDAIPAHRECKDCYGGDINKSHTGPKLAWQIQGLWDDSEGEA